MRSLLKASLMAAAVLIATPSIAADVTGDWAIEASLGDIPIYVNCTLVQTGEALSGTCTPVMEDPETSTLTGSVNGVQIEWSYDVFFNGAPGHVVFAGEIAEDDSLAGTLDLSGTPTTFTAARVTAE